ncbi:MAG TPA: YceI family protein [Gemmatimonadales bacterium]|jgi:polyisoprenoid-binding protein YceI
MHRVLRSIAVALLIAPTALAAQQQPAGPPPGGPGGQRQMAPLPPNGWRVDPGHSAVHFRVRHLGITWVNGEFQNWTAELVYDPAHPEASSVSAHIQTASVNTDNDRRDSDIKSGNYMAVDSFPEMTFVSRQVEKVDSTHLRIHGDLTLRGITKPVILDTEITGMLNGSRGKRVAFTGTTMINRQDYGVTLTRLMEGAQVVGNEIRITIDIEAVQPTST